MELGGLRTAYQLRTSALIELKEFDKAIASAQQVLDINDALLRVNPANAGARRNQAVVYAQLAKVSTSRGDWRKGRAFFVQARDIYLEQEKNGTLIPSYRARFASVTAAIAKCDEKLRK